MSQPKNSGRWKPGQSGNPGGRSGKTEKIRAQLATGAAAVAKVVLDQAKAGDMTACRLVLERLVPPVKPISEPVEFRLDETDLPASARSILSAIASGQIAPDQGKALIDAVTSLSRVIEVAELEKQLAELRELMEARQ
ncbi:DUF5681 domain-containing protein [Stutzerimonas kunmingensis]|uniref:DUF5681 domain-containing protein n=1 Tax=Stutzerimonas kunmingensis TaxID=1211807 RepID=A0A9X1N7V0_9GAMM|nr:DUF5681 domain-containing protein [Stutzerimonas kunmingensis]MCD1609844.1 DUF5681 domain-containing protein [Stutzerimonas kunmingensis]PNF99463.1 hypothetical protein CXK98_18300 [Stutzerimonas kunmingensis]